jgi:diaminopimelate decarboxylase
MEKGETNRLGHLVWGGCDCVKLAATYGTPTYVMDEAMITGRMKRYIAAASAYPNIGVAYASKAFACGALIRLVAREGLWLDVVSGGELHLALSAGMPAERIIFHGNNKSRDELAFGLESGVSRFVIDNRTELERLSGLASAARKRAEVLLRVAPGISPKTHRAVQTARVDSKFGFPVADGLAVDAARRALSLPGLVLRGFHCHIGSQIHDVYPFQVEARALARVAWEVESACGYLAEEINLGGGWGVHHLPQDDTSAQLELYVATAVAAFRNAWRRHGRPGAPLGLRGRGEPPAAASGGGSRRYSWPALYLEPGRSIVAEAGITLYTVGAVKPVPGYEAYVLVDGGMADNPRPALYGARYHAVIANRAAAAASGSYAIAGKACEAGDVLIRGVGLADPRPDDLVALFATGAYTHSMASNYNRLGRPAIVFCSQGQARLVVRRETYEDMERCDLEAAGQVRGALRLEVAAGRDAQRS